MAARPGVNLTPSPERRIAKLEGINNIPVRSSQMGNWLGRFDPPALRRTGTAAATLDRSERREAPLEKDVLVIAGNFLKTH